jgi:Peroxiredoxin
MSINELKEGIKAPDFKLMGSDDKEHSLSDYLGKKVIVYFYPKDNTPGCTIEANDFSDNIEKIKELNAVVLGISRDSLSSHKKFCNKYSLAFTLLSDKDENVCKIYDVIKEKNMYGKKTIGIERSTFIIDEQGIIKKIFRKVKVNEHVENIIKELIN